MRRSTYLEIVVIGLCFCAPALAFDSNEMSLRHFVIAENAAGTELTRNISGAGNSGAVISHGRLFVLEQEQGNTSACIREFDMNEDNIAGGGNIELAEVALTDGTGTIDLPELEGITYCGGGPNDDEWIFAVVNEGSNTVVFTV